MRKGVLVLVLLALALVVAGCTGGNDGTSSSSTPFIGGSEGLRVGFVENAPPSEVLDNSKPADKTQVQKFDIILKLENVGEQDILANSAKVTIGGLFPADFGVPGLATRTPSTLKDILFQKKLDGVKKDPDGSKISGGVEEMAFYDLGYVKQLEGNSQFPIQADICYKYTTKAVGDFCMRADLTRTQGGVCQAKGTKPVFSSGGPVQVTSVDESVGGRYKVVLKFNIKTTGSGSFFKPDDAGTAGAPNCVRGDFSRENFVKVTVNSGITSPAGSNGLTCSGSKGGEPLKGTQILEVRLNNGEGSITCVQDSVNVDALQKVNLQIEYNHLISASTSILVKHLPGFEGGQPSASTAGNTPAGTTGGSGGTTGGTGSSGSIVGTPCQAIDIPRNCVTSAGSSGINICQSGVWSACLV